MATTRTPGITVLADGRRFVDKRHLGVRIGLRVGGITQEQAEERLQTEMARVQGNAKRKAHTRPTFTACAARYIEQSRGKRGIDVIKWHSHPYALTVATKRYDGCSRRTAAFRQQASNAFLLQAANRRHAALAELWCG